MRRARGLTLVELMVVLAVMAILATVVYPMYTNQVRKARRADAMTAVQILALAQERYFTINGEYAGTLGSLDLAADIQGGNSTENYYALSLTRSGSDNEQFVATATAKSSAAQASDADCQTFSINFQGVKTSTDGSAATNNCW